VTPKKRAMYGFLGTSALHGVAEACLAYFAPTGSIVPIVTVAVVMLISLYFVFAWLQEDRRELQLPHSYLFDVGVVALGFIVIPVYLWRSRPPGRKVKAVLGMFAALIASLVLGILPMILGFVALGVIFGLPGN
jgi:hypothetical protein